MSFLKGILKSVAPVLASAIPGPLGSMARKVVTDLLGIKETSSQEAIEEALAKANPELLLKLKQADQDFQLKMEQLGIDLAKLEFEDTASARERHIAVRDKTLPVLAWTVVGGWLASLGFLFFYAPPAENVRLLDIMFGIETMAVGNVIGYYFGSSYGSSKKDATIQELSK